MRKPFTRSSETLGAPVPYVRDLRDLNDAELADYIAACGYEYDGMGSSVREAIVRLLRRPTTAGKREGGA